MGGAHTIRSTSATTIRRARECRRGNGGRASFSKPRQATNFPCDTSCFAIWTGCDIGQHLGAAHSRWQYHPGHEHRFARAQPVGSTCALEPSHSVGTHEQCACGVGGDGQAAQDDRKGQRVASRRNSRRNWPLAGNQSARTSNSQRADRPSAPWRRRSAVCDFASQKIIGCAREC